MEFITNTTFIMITICINGNIEYTIVITVWSLMISSMKTFPLEMNMWLLRIHFVVHIIPIGIYITRH